MENLELLKNVHLEHGLFAAINYVISVSIKFQNKNYAYLGIKSLFNLNGIIEYDEKMFNNRLRQLYLIGNELRQINLQDDYESYIKLFKRYDKGLEKIYLLMHQEIDKYHAIDDNNDYYNLISEIDEENENLEQNINELKEKIKSNNIRKNYLISKINEKKK